MIERLIKLLVFLLIATIGFPAAAFAGDTPVLEYGQVNNSSDGTTASGGSVYLKVVGQDKIYINSQIINEDGNYVWRGNVWFNDGTGPDAGQEHVVAVEKQVENVSYFATTSKTLSPQDISSPDGAQFPAVTLAKMYKPLGIASVNKIGLAISNVDSAHYGDSLWGYRIYRQEDDGSYIHLTDVSVAEAKFFIDDTANHNHSYKYKYKILTKDKEYEGQYFSAESEVFSPYASCSGYYAMIPSDVPTPDITNISHDYGSVDGGLLVTLTGSNFEGSWVFVDGEVVALAEGSPVQFFTPAHTQGKVKIRVQSVMKYDEVDFTYLNNPSITSCSPGTGNTHGGTTVEINGSYLYQGKTPVIKFGDAAAAVQGQPADEKVTVMTTPHIAGKVPVEVNLGNGVKGLKADAFEYIDPPPVKGDPTISNIVPKQGTVGTDVVIMGTNFSLPKVIFGSVEATIVNSSSTFIFTNAPQNDPGTVDIKVINDNGNGQSVTSHNAFTYLSYNEVPDEDYPTITGINPKSGKAGDIVIISGTELSKGLEPLVLFGVTTNSTNYVSVATVLNYTAESVVVTVPSNPWNQPTVNVILMRTDDGRTALSPTKFTYIVPTANTDPLISNISPQTGNAGDTVTITGVNLSRGLEPEVYFGVTTNTSISLAKAAVSSYTDETIVVKVPSNPSTSNVVDVVVKRSDGKEAKSPDQFTYEGEIKILGNLDIQKLVVDGTAVRDNDYINKTLTSVVVHVKFKNNAVLASGNATIVVGGANISVSFDAPATLNGTTTATLSSAQVAQMSNALEEGKNDITVNALSNQGATANVTDYSLWVAAEGEEVKLMPLPDGNLLLNYPNPFNPNGGESTAIVFALNKAATISIYIYDLKGMLIVNRDISAAVGYNNYIWNGNSDFGDICGTGAYFYRLAAEGSRVLGTGRLTIINK